MNPFRYPLNRKRFSTHSLHWFSNDTMLENSRELIVVRSLLNVLGIEPATRQAEHKAR